MRRIIESLEKSREVMALFQWLAVHEPTCYIGAGAIAQIYWNDQLNRPLHQGIKDIDIVYFSPTQPRDEEDRLKERILGDLLDFPFELDIKNQAWVHTWYQEKFGKELAPYQSIEEAIRTWPTSASAIIVRWTSEGWWAFAPFGCQDLLRGIVRPNPVLITQEVFENKVSRWKKAFPMVRIVPWTQDPLLQVARRVSRI